MSAVRELFMEMPLFRYSHLSTISPLPVAKWLLASQRISLVAAVHILILLGGFECYGEAGEARIQTAVSSGVASITLPPGLTLLSREIVIPEGTRGLTIAGDEIAGSTLQLSDTFNGRAALVVLGSSQVTFSGFTIQGSGRKPAPVKGLPPSNVPFYKYYSNNGILAHGARRLTVKSLTFKNVEGFAVLAAASEDVHLSGLLVEHSGSLNAKGRNNTTGGVLFEEGTVNFQVTGSTFREIAGNALWTHSMYGSPRNRNGVFSGNAFHSIGRDAIQVGHARDVRVSGNRGYRIGYPAEIVDAEGLGVPVGIDTAGDVSESVYEGNYFEEVNGKCIDLDGFHDGAVTRNTCINRGKASDYAFGNYAIVFNNSNIDMQSKNVVVEHNYLDGTKYGGIFVIGTNHIIRNNILVNLNRARCPGSHAEFSCLYKAGEPDYLSAGIYLATGAERPDIANGIRIVGNHISGWGMSGRCIVTAPRVSRSKQVVAANKCLDPLQGRQ